MIGNPEDKGQRIQVQLDRILSSKVFSGSERHRKFLRFLVEQALKGSADRLNEFVLGFEVFNKGDSFDPRIDSIVRVEARRLRERLKKYYQEEGRNDSLVITLRPRSFEPEFSEPSQAGKPSKGAGRVWFHSHRRIAVTAAVFVCGIVAAVFALPPWWRRPSPPQTVSVAVLPFQTLAARPDQEVLGNSIADAIVTGLASVPGLRILARRPADAGADYIVEGSVQVKDNRLRVSVKMTDTRAGSYIWAETRESEVTALADLQRSLSSSLAARLRLPLPPGGGDFVMRRRPADPEAYAAFLKGQYYWYQTDSSSVEKSIALFEEAIRRDSNYAPAWAWLSQSYLILAQRGDGRDASVIARGRQAAGKAIALDDQLAEAHAAVGSFAALDWDWSGAQRSLRRAIQLNPGWAQGHVTYSLMYLLPTGQLREALGEMLRAHELDPLTRTTRLMLAEVLYFNRQYSRAIAESEDLFMPSNRVYLLSLSLSGQGSRAMKELAPALPPAEDVSPAVGVMGYILAKHGDRNRARAVQRRLIEASAGTYVSPLAIAMVSTGLDDKEEAFRQLRNAVANHVPAVAQVGVDPVFEPLRADPRFAGLLQAIGLPSS